MMKKVLLLAVAFTLVAQVALAAGPQQGGPNPGVGNIMRHYFGEMRQGLNVGPKMAANQRRINQAKECQEDLEALAQADPAALAARMLERHDAMVARAQELIANQATLAARIVADLKAAQTRVMAHATEQAKNAKDPAVAARRLAALQTRQTRVLAAVEKNAVQMAERMIDRAEAILANAPTIRARIEAGEGLAIIRENQQRRRQQMRQNKKPTGQ